MVTFVLKPNKNATIVPKLQVIWIQKHVK